MTWVYLIISIVFEVAGTTSMKMSEGFTKVWPSVFIFVFYAIAFIFLTISLKKLPVSLAYAMWAGIGTLLISLVGAFYFNEGLGVLKVISIALIILGVVGLNLISPHA
jgi:small multidrug resistance pump